MIRRKFDVAAVAAVSALAMACGGSQGAPPADPAPTPVAQEPAPVEPEPEPEPVMSTQEVLEHHLAAFGNKDMDAMLSDYTAESVFITPMATLRGPDALKPVFEGLFAEFAKPGAEFTMIKMAVKGEIGYIVWSAKTADNAYELGTDTFVVRDGKIAYQTFAAVVVPTGGKAAAMPPFAGPMPEDENAAVVLRHLDAFGKRDMDAMLADYADDVTLFTPAGELVGHEGVKPMFTAMFAEFAKPGAKLAMHSVVSVDDVVFIVWSGETADNVYQMGTDTFVIADGKIANQTFAFKGTPKPAKPAKKKKK